MKEATRYKRSIKSNGTLIADNQVEAQSRRLTTSECLTEGNTQLVSKPKNQNNHINIIGIFMKIKGTNTWSNNEHKTQSYI